MKLTKEKMSYIYTTLLFSNTSDGFYKHLNRLIVRNWSLSGLEDIKKKAWELSEDIANWEKEVADKPKTEQEIALFDKEAK